MMVHQEVFKCYQQLSGIGVGGFAQVVKVRHRELGYVRALKLFNTPIGGKEEKAYQDFLKECKVLMRIGNGNNTHIVSIYSPQLLGDTALYEMDYIEGCNLYQWVERQEGLVPVDEVIRTAQHISSALRYCHRDNYLHNMDRVADNIPKDPENGARLLVDEQKEQELIAKYRVLHNDLHPGNIMRSDYDQRYVLLDFGLAITQEYGVTLSRLRNGVEGFMSPEKLQEKSQLLPASAITPASDVYSFGAVLYYLLTGQRRVSYRQVTSESLFEARRSAYSRKYPQQALSEPDYPEWLAAVLLRCLELHPSDRFADGYELHCCIQEHLSEAKEHTTLSAQQPAEETVEQLREQLRRQEEQIVLLQNQYRTLQIGHQLKEEQLQRINQQLKALLEEERRKHS